MAEDQDTAQKERDWAEFAELFEKREGFAPNRNDMRARELHFWFTCGAHSERVGALAVKHTAIKAKP